MHLQAICTTIAPTNKPTNGYIRPIWIINEDGSWVAVNNENFPCETGQVFVKSGYDSLSVTYSDSFFKISIQDNPQPKNPDSHFYCAFVADGQSAKRLEDKELVQVVDDKLPDPNNCFLDALDDNIMTRYIVIEDSNKYIYGIFKNDISSIDETGYYNAKLSVLNSPFIFPQEKYEITILKANREQLNHTQIIDAIFRGKRISFIHNISDFIKEKNSERISFMSDEEVLRFGAEILTQVSPHAFKAKDIQLHKKNLDNSKIKNRKYILERFFDIISKIENISLQQTKWIDEYLKSSETSTEIISNIIQKNPEILQRYFVSHYNEKKSEIDSKLEELKNILNEKQSQLKDTTNKLQQLNRQLEVAESQQQNKSYESIQNIKDSLDKTLTSKKNELTQIEENITKAKSELRQYTDLSGIEKEKAKLSTILDYIKQEIKEKTQEKDEINNKLREGELALKKKLFEYKTYFDVLTDFSPENTSNSNNYDVTTEKNLNDDATKSLELRDDLLEKLTRIFKTHQRNYSKYDIANFLICIQQSFFCIFAGLPGVGKTSLINLLANALNISKRLQSISVGRGWTSQKDLIGYFNPLNGKFQNSATGFYDFIKGIETNCYDDSANAFVLLDEANLSPIEHYWSSFMGMTDDIERGSLQLGNENISIFKGLRFIGTINYDSTTEILSPRMLNRSPVILLETNTNITFNDEPELNGLNELVNVYSAQTMDKWFGIPSSSLNTESTELDKILEEVIKICTDNNSKMGKPIAISHRKINAIKRYCQQANPIMRTEKDTLAVDYAIAQFILPLIDGQGSQYKNRLDELRKIIETNKLDSKSLPLIINIIESGQQDLDSYSYFVWK
jgi:hypothetical protein